MEVYDIEYVNEQLTLMIEENKDLPMYIRIMLNNIKDIIINNPKILYDEQLLDLLQTQKYDLYNINKYLTKYLYK